MLETKQDRSDGYGVVFSACHKSYNWENLPLTTSTSEHNLEVVAYKLQFKNNVHIVMAVYRVDHPIVISLTFN